MTHRAPIRHPDYFSRQVREIPAFRALIRAIECRLFDEAGELSEPILDLGCGDGHFAAHAYRRPPLVGIDLDEASVRETQARGVYQSLAVASATHLPFANDSFASVTANCVIEHIPDVEATMAEIARVLRPGGRLIFGVPSHRFPDLLFGSTLLRRLGARRLGQSYGQWFNWHSAHFTTDSPDLWHDRLVRHGLMVDHWEYYMSPAATRAFDVAHYLGVPRLVSRKLTGKWVAFANPLANSWFTRWLGSYAVEPPPAVGACIFFHARKPLSPS